MKQVICKNCGAVFDDSREMCPYCGTMNHKGAYRSFRAKVAGVIDQMLGLQVEVYQSTRRMILSSFLRSLVLIAAVIGIAFVCSRSARVNYYSDPEYDRQAYENIVWEDENLEKLDEAYAANDFKTIRRLYAENSNAVRRWPHYTDYVLKDAYQNICEATVFTSYQLQNVLYFLFDPDYFAYGNGMQNADPEQYEAMRSDVLKRMEEKGYSEQELSDIYQANADSYGYLSASDLEAYLKEE